MTTIYLIRHAANDSLGRWVAGRTPGLHLNETGRRQANSLAERMGGLPLAALYTSPLQRAQETAEPLAVRLGIEVQVRDEFSEVRFGQWEGRTLEHLEADPRWYQFRRYRSGTRPPEGETTSEVAARATAGLLSLRNAHPDEAVAVYTHADVVKVCLAWVLSIPFDFFWRLEISPASVTTVELEERGSRVVGINDTGALHRP